MAQLLVAPFEELAPEIRPGRQVLLFSDFDGTLVPLKDRPEDCFLDSATAALLRRLAQHPQVVVGIVSGRQLADVCPRVGLPGLAYAGNHGLEIEGPGFTFREPSAVRLQPTLEQVLADLADVVANIPGAWIQPKGLSASVHYRQVAPVDVPRLVRAVEEVAAPALQAQQLVLRPGKAVLEIRPAVDWDKGKAVRWLVEQLRQPPGSPLIVYLGDDATDEDAFAACPEALTILVGETRPTAARYRLNHSAEVHDFLGWLSRQLPPAPSLHP